jgi:hypothetical protein
MVNPLMVNAAKTASFKRTSSSKLRYRSAGHALHPVTDTGTAEGAPTLKRTTPSEVAQKLLAPVLSETGVAMTTYSWHCCSLQIAFTRNWNPDFVH